MKVDAGRIRRTIEGIAQFGRDPAGGWSRFAFTEEERQARDYVCGLMREAGMQVRIDAAGNVFGRRPGRDPELPAVASGSHIDTVKNGGMYDGVTGVAVAIEAVHLIHEQGIETRHPLEVIVFANEEGARFNNGLWGSRSMLGIIQQKELHEIKDAEGLTVGEAMRSAGLDPERIEEAKISDQNYRAMIEVHPEQSHVLENKGISLGIVETIAGGAWLKILFKGRPDHAGATPMEMRRDALAAAAAVVLEIEEIARNKAGAHTVATVGQLTVKPGGINIIPGEVEMTLDIRDVSMEDREQALNDIREAAADAGARRDIEVAVEEIGQFMSVPLHEEIVKLIEKSCREEGISCCRLNSGAGHDVQVMSFLTKTGLIFVPSVNGISHSPAEETPIEDIAGAAQVLLKCMLELAS